LLANSRQTGGAVHIYIRADLKTSQSHQPPLVVQTSVSQILFLAKKPVLERPPLAAPRPAVIDRLRAKIL
jgi:hypothetical protein